MKRIFKGNLIFIAIVLLSFVLRFIFLDLIPSGFHSDEAAFGYNAYSLLLTGKDEYGETLPLILKSFDDYKGAVYAYLTIPAVAVFGLTEFAVRLPTAVFGFLLVILSYFLTLRLTKDKKISLLTSLLVSINPLSIFLSRVQSDPLVSVFFMLLGFYLFLLWIDKNRIYLIISSLVLWIASIYTYPSPRVLIPVLFFSILIFYFKKLTLSQKKVLIVIFIVVAIVDMMVITGASQRLKQLSVINAPIVSLPMEEKIREDSGGNVFVTRMFHNKIVDHALVVGKNYFDYFNADFLFLEGGQPDREKVPGIGVIYLFALPFLLYGIYLGVKSKEKWGKLSILLVVLFPFALSFAVDESPNVHRYFINIYFLELLIALGIISFLKNVKDRYPAFQKVVIAILALLIIFNFSYFLHQLVVHQTRHQPWYRGFAYKELVTKLSKIDKKYNKVLFTKAHASPYIYVLFFKKYDPSTYQMIGSPRDLDNTGFDNYIFTPEDCPLQFHTDKTDKVIVDGQEGILYVNRGSCPIPPHSVNVIKTINWEDNNPAFTILEYTNNE